MNKDELVQLLKNGLIDEFNSNRTYDEENLLDLTEIDLTDISISGTNLSKVDLSGSDLSKSELEGVNFSESDLSSVNFSHSTITESNLSDVILEGSFFNNANVNKCDFASTDFHGVNISATDLSESDLSLCKNLMHAVYDEETVWPDDDLLPEDFDPQYDLSFAELEDDNEYSEDQLSY